MCKCAVLKDEELSLIFFKETGFFWEIYNVQKGFALPGSSPAWYFYSHNAKAPNRSWRRSNATVTCWDPNNTAPISRFPVGILSASEVHDKPIGLLPNHVSTCPWTTGKCQESNHTAGNKKQEGLIASLVFNYVGEGTLLSHDPMAQSTLPTLPTQDPKIWAPNTNTNTNYLVPRGLRRFPAKPKRSDSTSNNSGKEKMLKFFCFPQNAVSCALVCRSPWGIAMS